MIFRLLISTLSVYGIFTAIFFFGYSMIWFTDMVRPSLDIMQWDNLGRWILFIYAFLMGPLFTGLVYSNLKNK